MFFPRRMPRCALLLITACLAGLSPLPGGAETDFSNLTPAEDALLRAELRDILAGLPQLLPPGHLDPRPPAPLIETAYADEAADDLSRIARNEDALFGTAQPGFGPAQARHVIALFTRKDCAECARAEAELRQLGETTDLRVTLIDIDANTALAEALELDGAPSYVLPRMMLRGHIPPIVLERYLAE